MSADTKLYFRDIDSEICYKLVGFIAEAIDDELEEVHLLKLFQTLTIKITSGVRVMGLV